MASKRTYDPEVKAAAIAALMEGQSVAFVAREYDIPSSTLRNWKSQDVLDVGREKKEEIGDLIIALLQASLTSLKSQTEHFGNKIWLAEQTAEGLAMLHGVQTDKAIRIIEALSKSDDSST